MQAQAAQLQRLIAGSARIAFLGGAGVSTESGIPDFRGEQGVFKAMAQFGRPPEELLHIDFFRRSPEIFYAYYKSLMLRPGAAPNPAHMALARLEAQGKLSAVITQNIDGLHQLAGSRTVLELHGSMQRNYCTRCKRQYGLERILDSDGIPLCDCGDMIRPDVVLYGECLDEAVLAAAISHIRKAELLIVGGTSLVVYPAAGLLSYFKGRHLVLINKSSTPYDHEASLVINAPIGAVLGACIETDNPEA